MRSPEHAWNGLLNNFILERVVGLQPDLPAETLTIEPNVPDHLKTISAVIPLGGHWTSVAHCVDHTDDVTVTTTVKNAALKTTRLRYRTPNGLTLAGATING